MTHLTYLDDLSFEPLDGPLSYERQTPLPEFHFEPLEPAATSIAAAIASGLRRMGYNLILGTLLVGILMAATALYVILSEFANLLTTITGAM